MCSPALPLASVPPRCPLLPTGCSQRNSSCVSHTVLPFIRGDPQAAALQHTKTQGVQSESQNHRGSCLESAARRSTSLSPLVSPRCDARCRCCLLSLTALPPGCSLLERQLPLWGWGGMSGSTGSIAPTLCAGRSRERLLRELVLCPDPPASPLQLGKDGHSQGSLVLEVEGSPWCLLQGMGTEATTGRHHRSPSCHRICHEVELPGDFAEGRKAEKPHRVEGESSARLLGVKNKEDFARRRRFVLLCC